MDTCPLCHKPFRGDWDQVETSEGVLCDTCANSAERLARHAERDVVPSAVRAVPIAIPIEDEPEPAHVQDGTEKLHLALLVGGFVLAMLLIIALPGGEAPAKSAVAESGSSSRALLLSLLIGFGVHLTCLNLLLRWTRRITVRWGGISGIAAIALGFTLLDGFVGLIPLPLIGILALCAQAYFLVRHFGVWKYEIANYVALRLLFGFIGFLLEALLLGILAIVLG